MLAEAKIALIKAMVFNIPPVIPFMLIKGALAYFEGKFQKKDIVIKGERIAKIANRLDAKEEQKVNANGLLAFPGLIDMHVHLREPGQTQKEDFLSGSKAALAGGYTLVYDMPNNFPKPTITKEALEEKKALAKKALCEIRFHFGATNTNFEEVKEANPESLKFYLGKTTGNILLDDENAILRHMREFPAEKQVIAHAQSGESEEDATGGVRKAVALAGKVNRKIHITHASTIMELEAAKTWKYATVDTTPHYLFLSKEDGRKMKPKEKGLVHPPLRSKKNSGLMWKALGRIDAIVTDHAPHLIEEKVSGARGFPGLETALALFLDRYSGKRIGLEWIVQRFSENPAKIMGLKEYGKIREGCFANITLIDPKREWKVKGEELYTKCGWSPFEGRRLKGRVVKTICMGKMAFSLPD